MLVMSEEEVDQMERELLKDQERIKTNIFEGKVLSRTFKEITDGPSPTYDPLSPTHYLPRFSGGAVSDRRMGQLNQTRKDRKNSPNRRLQHKQRIPLLCRLGSLPHFLRQLYQTPQTQTGHPRSPRLLSFMSRWRRSRPLQWLSSCFSPKVCGVYGQGSEEDAAVLLSTA